MATVPIDIAATQLPELLARAEAGEEVVIASGAHRGVKLVPQDVKRNANPYGRRFGTLGPISDEEAEEALRPLPKEYWGDIGDDED